MVKKIAVVTTSRADYGIQRPLIKELSRVQGVQLELLVSGSHLMPSRGNSFTEIEKDGFMFTRMPVEDIGGGEPEAITAIMAQTLKVFGHHFAQFRPDLLFVFGDRFEMFAAATAAVPFIIPMAHIAGGAVTAGAIDNVFRHGLTKMSNLHFVETEVHRSKVLNLGEKTENVHVVGALNLDNVRLLGELEPAKTLKELGLPADSQPLLVTYHPETISDMSPLHQIKQVIAGLANFKSVPLIVTGANIDTHADLIRSELQQYIKSRNNAVFVESLGTRRYFAVMKVASAMVGNSSSGLIEASTFGLPVVNIGGRQSGRLTPENVLSCRCDAVEITSAITKATSAMFKTKISDLKNPYGDGFAATKIVKILEKLDVKTLVKD